MDVSSAEKLDWVDFCGEALHLLHQLGDNACDDSPSRLFHHAYRAHVEHLPACHEVNVDALVRAPDCVLYLLHRHAHGASQPTFVLSVQDLQELDPALGLSACQIP